MGELGLVIPWWDTHSLLTRSTDVSLKNGESMNKLVNGVTWVEEGLFVMGSELNVTSPTVVALL